MILAFVLGVGLGILVSIVTGYTLVLNHTFIETFLQTARMDNPKLYRKICGCDKR